uniref:Cilia and flagella associated protein 77 n=1 Tax=Esox lucius TaxID=8010 RepID=A0AAY5L0V3_ESOLU
MQVSHVGVVRESMLANPLLIRPVLGKTKSNGLAFPGPDFVYGTVTTTQDGGVSEALSNWRAHSVPTSGCSSQSRRPEKDFVAMNREGVKSGLVTAKEHYQYRATQDRRRAAPARVRSHVPAPPRIPPDTTFGISTRRNIQGDRGRHRGRETGRKDTNSQPIRGSNSHCHKQFEVRYQELRFRTLEWPSTPIHELLEHKYAQLWLQEQKVKEKAREEDKLNKPKLGRIPETRTTLLRKSRPVPESAPLWKLPRFQQIGPALDTFRDPHARKKAFSAHLSDSVARRGQLGQGTYTMG